MCYIKERFFLFFSFIFSHLLMFARSHSLSSSLSLYITCFLFSFLSISFLMQTIMKRSWNATAANPYLIQISWLCLCVCVCSSVKHHVQHIITLLLSIPVEWIVPGYRCICIPNINFYIFILLLISSTMKMILFLFIFFIFLFFYISYVFFFFIYYCIKWSFSDGL